MIVRHKVISAAVPLLPCSWYTLLRIGVLPTSATDTSATALEQSTYTYSRVHSGIDIRSNFSRVFLLPLLRCYLSCIRPFSTLPLCCGFLCLGTNSGRHRCLSTPTNLRGSNTPVLGGRSDDHVTNWEKLRIINADGRANPVSEIIW